jgi:serine/threonine protein kinase
MGTLSDWEKVNPKPLGEGGQSTVYLVRKPERVNARDESFQVLKNLSGQGLHNQSPALRFSQAAFDVAREDYASELGALKMFKPRAAGENAEKQARERMQNEISVLKENRPGLLKLLDYSESENWIVTEYCPGGTLDRHLDRYKGNAKLALEFFFPLVQTVLGLHNEQIVHRDIKPQNIFLGETGKFLLGDFGIVFLPNQAERVSITGESVGPRDFMPPWVMIEEFPTIKPKFDVYMLGKVLWCMVSGRLKLHREDFRDPRLDVTKLFPNDPDMYIINQILEKCVVTREQDCLPSAQDLYLMVGKYLEMTQLGGQLLSDGVPRPCHVCGLGQYRPERFRSNIAEGGVRFWLSGSETASLWLQPWACDHCGHVELFMPHH